MKCSAAIVFLVYGVSSKLKVGRKCYYARCSSWHYHRQYWPPFLCLYQVVICNLARCTAYPFTTTSLSIREHRLLASTFSAVLKEIDWRCARRQHSGMRVAPQSSSVTIDEKTIRVLVLRSKPPSECESWMPRCFPSSRSLLNHVIDGDLLSTIIRLHSAGTLVDLVPRFSWNVLRKRTVGALNKILNLPTYRWGGLFETRAIAAGESTNCSHVCLRSTGVRAICWCQ